MAARVKNVFKRYGRTAFFFHSAVFTSTLVGSYAAINQGVDLQAVAKRVPFIDLSSMDPDASTLALAYLSTVATGPVRGALTIAASPILARLLTRSRQLTKF
ncbi:Predicted membrane protein [Plasmopara halstedii]|uniref:Predicted membrane protein n=1 Tax=Plasmopara halstedii TaxID=4781 RepID=A0A0P1A7Q6_PLAHL|nr:Predicted membrane protein [Plasmopara halstedii]CEG36457.1 Predicted membrane protein [Plasmopara halstedii]|eukprot:XP_024572826.1 Predicted membrane protein [Plasmopara halstedii]